MSSADQGPVTRSCLHSQSIPPINTPYWCLSVTYIDRTSTEQINSPIQEGVAFDFRFVYVFVNTIHHENILRGVIRPNTSFRFTPKHESSYTAPIGKSAENQEASKKGGSYIHPMAV